MRTLVLLHGWGMTPAVFDALADLLRPSYAVRAMALPGYCGEPPVTPYALPTLAAALAARAPECCCVAGWSLGAQVALEWARSKPRQVEALALIGATPSFVQRPGWTPAVEPDVFEAFVEGVEAGRDATLARFASLQAQGDAAMKTVAARLRACVAGPTQVDASALQRGLSVLLDTDLRSALRDIDQPALVIHGDSDRLVPPGAGEYLARELPHARLETVPGAAHAPFVSRPAAVAAALKDFLR